MNTEVNYSSEDLRQLDEVVEILKNGMPLDCKQSESDQRLYRILKVKNLITTRDSTTGITYIEAKTDSPIMLDPSWTFSGAYNKAKAEKERMQGHTYIDQSQTTIIGNENTIKDKKQVRQGTMEVEKQSIWNKIIAMVATIFKAN